VIRRVISTLVAALLVVPTASVAQIYYPPRAPVGALVKRAADQIAADFSGGVAISWDAETYDAANFHDTVTNNQRIIIPAGVNRVQCGTTITLANDTIGGNLTVIVRKNGATSYDGVGQTTIDVITTTAALNVITAPVDVVAGDYFEAVVFNVGDTSVDLTAARSNFWCQVLG
jgi:hypothetical protein